MKLDDETKKLIALGACVAANCKPCLEAQMEQAKSMGIGDTEIGIAMKIGQSVRNGAADRMDDFISGIAGKEQVAPNAGPKMRACCC